MGFAANTKALIDCESSLVDVSDQGKNATLVSTAVYQTAGAWHGSKAFSSSSGGRFKFTGVQAVIAAAGCMEASFRTSAVADGKALWSVNAASGNRALDIYQFSNGLFAYGNGVGGTNSGFMAVSPNTNYYIKDTWDGAGHRQIWAGAWTVAGTVTLAKVFDSTACSLASVNEAVFLNNAASNGSDLAIDWVRIRDVYDNTGAVTVDPSATGSRVGSPSFRRRVR